MKRMSLQNRNLLRRYLKLLTRFQTERVEVSLQDVAESMACTPRYARTLLHSMQEEGWVTWCPHSGRGALGMLQCWVNMVTLQAMMDEIYAVTPPASDSSGAEPPPADDGFHYWASFYHPLLTFTPSLTSTRVERHIFQMIHVGLTRWQADKVFPVPGLAHTIEVSEDGLIWMFVLRRGLVWHNGEVVYPEQLLDRLRTFINTPGLPYVDEITLTGHTFFFHLTQPDVKLPERLANPVYALIHPTEITCGLGPFRVKEYNRERLELIRAPGWYGETPQASTITFEMNLRKSSDWATVKVRTSPPSPVPEPVQIKESHDGFYFLTVNESRQPLQSIQQAVLRQFICTLTYEPIANTCCGGHLPGWLRSNSDIPEQVTLPPVLRLAYFQTPDMEQVVKELAKRLAYFGCQLVSVPVVSTQWLLPMENWNEQDICLGYLQFGQDHAFSMEERYRLSVMLQAFWPAKRRDTGMKIINRIVSGPRDKYSRRILRLTRYAIKRHWFTPLWSQRYRLEIPEHVHDVLCHPQCWPDFTQLWMAETDPCNDSEHCLTSQWVTWNHLEA